MTQTGSKRADLASGELNQLGTNLCQHGDLFRLPKQATKRGKAVQPLERGAVKRLGQTV